MNSKGKIVIYRGLPGSGKTSRAQDSIFIHGGRMVGRDHIRPLVGVDVLADGYGTPKQEVEVSEIQERLIVRGVTSGENVHVDDMNLRAKYVKRLIGLADHLDTEFEIVDLTNTRLGVCIQRDADRAMQGRRSVGADVIANLWDKFLSNSTYPMPVPESDREALQLLTPRPYHPVAGTKPAVLIDLDGTVADHDGVRGHHDYDLVSRDKPKFAVIDAVRAAVASGLYPVFVSGRPNSYSCKFDTSIWIYKHVYDGPFHLFMRQDGDHRPDYIVKMEIFDNNIRNQFDVRYALDDRDQVVRMYRELGLTVFQVAPGNF